VSVINPGPVIDAQHLGRLFDRFYRIGPARQHKGDGAGLGLAIVKSIVESHGGSVDASSRAGRTCFRLRLPLQAAGA
jgi:two-component system, OmpR family, heavy metal sensor histidine kinase CusS